MCNYISSCGSMVWTPSSESIPETIFCKNYRNGYFLEMSQHSNIQQWIVFMPNGIPLRQLGPSGADVNTIILSGGNRGVKSRTKSTTVFTHVMGLHM